MFLVDSNQDDAGSVASHSPDTGALVSKRHREPFRLDDKSLDGQPRLFYTLAKSTIGKYLQPKRSKGKLVLVGLWERIVLEAIDGSGSAVLAQATGPHPICVFQYPYNQELVLVRLQQDQSGSSTSYYVDVACSSLSADVRTVDYGDIMERREDGLLNKHRALGLTPWSVARCRSRVDCGIDWAYHLNRLCKSTRGWDALGTMHSHAGSITTSTTNARSANTVATAAPSTGSAKTSLLDSPVSMEFEASANAIVDGFFDNATDLVPASSNWGAYSPNQISHHSGGVTYDEECRSSSDGSPAPSSRLRSPATTLSAPTFLFSTADGLLPQNDFSSLLASAVSLPVWGSLDRECARLMVQRRSEFESKTGLMIEEDPNWSASAYVQRLELRSQELRINNNWFKCTQRLVLDPTINVLPREKWFLFRLGSYPGEPIDELKMLQHSTGFSANLDSSLGLTQWNSQRRSWEITLNIPTFYPDRGDIFDLWPSVEDTHPLHRQVQYCWYAVMAQSTSSASAQLMYSFKVKYVSRGSPSDEFSFGGSGGDHFWNPDASGDSGNEDHSPHGGSGAGSDHEHEHDGDQDTGGSTPSANSGKRPRYAADRSDPVQEAAASAPAESEGAKPVVPSAHEAAPAAAPAPITAVVLPKSLPRVVPQLVLPSPKKQSLRSGISKQQSRRPRSARGPVEPFSVRSERVSLFEVQPALIDQSAAEQKEPTISTSSGAYVKAAKLKAKAMSALFTLALCTLLCFGTGLLSYGALNSSPSYVWTPGLGDPWHVVARAMQGARGLNAHHGRSLAPVHPLCSSSSTAGGYCRFGGPIRAAPNLSAFTRSHGVSVNGHYSESASAAPHQQRDHDHHSPSWSSQLTALLSVFNGVAVQAAASTLLLGVLAVGTRQVLLPGVIHRASGTVDAQPIAVVA